MYSKETLSNYVERLDKAIEFYARFPVESLEICISAGNNKIGLVPNVSLPAIRTCPNCNKCMLECYDIKACMQYENVMKARARNYSILKRNFDLYWEQLRNKLKRMKTRFFRFHVGGDMISYEYFVEMVKTAKMFHQITFWTYTKNHKAVNLYVDNNGKSKEKAIPENLSIMFSVWEGMKTENPYKFGEFIVIEKGAKAPENAWHCPGNCSICMKAKRGCIINETSYIEKH